MKNNFNEKRIREIVKEVIDDYLNKTIVTSKQLLVTEMLNLAVSAKRLPIWLEKLFGLKDRCSRLQYIKTPTDFDYVALQKKEVGVALNNQGLEGAVDFYISVFESFENVSFQDFQNVINWMDNHGWYFAYIEAIPRYDDLKVFNQFTNEIYDYCNTECKHVKIHFRNIKGKIDNNIPSVCYHITSIIAEGKIVANGLKPNCRTRVEMHPQRLYLYTEYPQDNITKLVSEFRKSEKYDRRRDGYTVFKIYMDEIKEVQPFYQDDNTSPFAKGIYTNEPISPKYIEVYQRLKFEKDGKVTIESV